ncbi:MAG: glycosyltransferase family 1 protein [Archangium sp.]|nr:glycosyltransferase family 1 protein [Archangium sp.]
MRIGFFVPYFDPRPAGVGVYIEEIGKRLCARNAETVVYTPRPEVMPAWLKPHQLRYLSAGMPSLGGAGAQRRALRLAWLLAGARRAVVRDRVDVFLSPGPEVALGLPVPSVMVIHDLTVLRFPEAYQRATVLQTRYLLPQMARTATRIVAVSENTKRDLVSDLGLAGSGIDVVGEGFDAATFYPRDEATVASVRAKFDLKRPFLFYAGTLSRHKNLKVVLQALAALSVSEPELEFVLGGRKDVGVGGELDREAARLGLSSRFRSLGYVTRDELAALMSACAAFVYPSRYEGFGLAPLEAMACGAPVVASRVASLPEVIGDGGFLVPEGQDWASVIQQAINAPRAVQAARAVAQAQRFDWDVAVDQLQSVLERVVRENQ